MPIQGPPLNKPFPLGQILKHGLESKPYDLALVSAQTRWTWKELEQASDRLAVNLLRPRPKERGPGRFSHAQSSCTPYPLSGLY